MSLETVAPFWRHRRYRGDMVSIQIKHVPDETHAVLTRRAAAAHQSLQEYLLALLVDEASTPTNAEIFEEIEREGTGVTLSIQDVLGALDAEREGR
jgi:hypothetical protein